MHEHLYTLIADFAIEGRLAYLSHQETLTLFGRAFARARVNLVFSGGFNPRPRLSVPLPRSVGTQSAADRLCAVVEYAEPPAPAALKDALNAQLPDGCRILSLELEPGKVVFHPESCRLVFETDAPFDAARQAHLDRCRRAVEAREPIVIERFAHKKQAYKNVDLANYLEQVETDNNQITVTCRVSPEGTVRLDELMQWLDIRPEQLRQPVRRTTINWSRN